MTFTYEAEGLFSSVWYDTTCYIAAGSSNGKLLIAGISRSGRQLWDTLITTPFTTERAWLDYSGLGELLVVGTADPDTAVAGASGLLFLRIDTAGDVLETKRIDESNYIAAGGMTESTSGYIYLPLTRKSEFAQSKASVACYNNSFQKIWETDLYNNPEFGAAALAVAPAGNSGYVYVSGRTQVTRASGTIDNSFVSCLNTSGSVQWKKYKEINNLSTGLLPDENKIMMLNRNCFVVNFVSATDGEEEGIIRVLDACEASTTDAFGYCMDMNYDGNLILAGSRKGNFYVALKAVAL